jgi:hypothetical protein
MCANECARMIQQKPGIGLSVFSTCLCALASEACCDKKDITMNTYSALVDQQAERRRTCFGRIYDDLQ